MPLRVRRAHQTHTPAARARCVQFRTKCCAAPGVRLYICHVPRAACSAPRGRFGRYDAVRGKPPPARSPSLGRGVQPSPLRRTACRPLPQAAACVQSRGVC
ncbi:hypothetical protein EON67_05120 [archaeon]|nr:MAG: hypothetical protein EON67_05120 [archaeon]